MIRPSQLGYLVLGIAIGIGLRCSNAEPTYWTAPIGSHHFGTEGLVSVSGVNPGFGLERRDGDFSYGAGAYRNSLRRLTVYGETTYVPLHIGPARVGGLVGVATGYDSHPILAAMGIVRFNGFDITLTPKIPHRAPGDIGLRLTGKFR